MPGGGTAESGIGRGVPSADLQRVGVMSADFQASKAEHLGVSGGGAKWMWDWAATRRSSKTWFLHVGPGQSQGKMCGSGRSRPGLGFGGLLALFLPVGHLRRLFLFRHPSRALD